MTPDTTRALEHESARYPRNCDVRTVDASISEVSEFFETSLSMMDYEVDKRVHKSRNISLAGTLHSSDMLTLFKRLGRHETKIEIKETQPGTARIQITLRSHPPFCKRFCIVLSLYLVAMHLTFHTMLDLASNRLPFVDLFFGLFAMFGLGILGLTLFAFSVKTGHQTLCRNLYIQLGEQVGAKVKVIQAMRGSFEVTIVPTIILFTFPLLFVPHVNNPTIGRPFTFLAIVCFLLASVHYHVGNPSRRMTATISIPAVVILAMSFTLSLLGILPFIARYLPPSLQLMEILAITIGFSFVPTFVHAAIKELGTNSVFGTTQNSGRWDFADSVMAGAVLLSGILQWLGASLGIYYLWTLLMGRAAFGSESSLCGYILLAFYWLLFFLPICFLLWGNISLGIKELRGRNPASDVPPDCVTDTSNLCQRICDWARISPPRIVFENVGLNAAHVKIPVIPFSRCTLVVPKEAYQQLLGDQFEALLAHEIGHLAHKHVLRLSILDFFSRWMFLGELGLSLFYRPSTTVESEADKFAVRWLERPGGSPDGRQGLVDLLKEIERRNIGATLEVIRGSRVGISSSDLKSWLQTKVGFTSEEFQQAAFEERLAMSLRLIRFFYFDAWQAIYVYLPFNARIKQIMML